jgi:hypothetical protein
MQFSIVHEKIKYEYSYQKKKKTLPINAEELVCSKQYKRKIKRK